MVSATEAKNRLASIITWVQDNQDEVIVENHGEPKAVIMA
jgi:prevent-host-death family protein